MGSRSQSRAWKEWLATHGSRLLLFARGWAGNRDDAEDLVQEAVLKLWNYQQERGGDPPDLPLAFTTIRFCGLNQGRRERRRRRREDSVVYLEEYRDTWFDPGVETGEEAERLRKAVAELPDKLREVVTLKVWGGLTFAQIGESLTISPNTAASRYRYALERLAGSLEDIRKARHETG
jgi:RNA polymerase sigma-70 factor (ECF subfamily)